MHFANRAWNCMLDLLIVILGCAFVPCNAAGGHNEDPCCQTVLPKAVKARVYNQSFSFPHVRTTDAQAASLVESSFLTRGASRPVRAVAPSSLAVCVVGQARGFGPVRPLGRALIGGGEVDVFAVIELDCRPHTCTGNVLARTRHWMRSQRVRNAIITVNNTPISTVSTAAAWFSRAGTYAEPPPVPGCAARQAMKRAHPNWPSTFYHQQTRAQQCMGLVRNAEVMRGARYNWVVRARPEFAATCVCPLRQPLSPMRIYSIDVCNIREKGPLLCDAFWVVPRRWTNIVFNAVDGWTDCSAYRALFPCHEPSGVAPECMLTAWLVDNGIPRSAFGKDTELRELGVVRIYSKTQAGLVYCNLRHPETCQTRAPTR